MFHQLRRHPFAVQAHFDHCLVLTFALPASVLTPLLPPGLALDQHGDLGFLAVALVQTRDLRPAGWPKALGQDFFLSGYRIFTRYLTLGGRNLRGLRILRSDTDSRRMAFAGNLLTHYKYRPCKVHLAVDHGSMTVQVKTPNKEADLHVTADLTPASGPPSGSPFATLQDARKFAGPLPFTFDHEPQTDSIIMIEGRRPTWDPRPVSVDVQGLSFLKGPAFVGCDPVLANAFYVADVPYRWERGVRQKLPQGAAT